MFKKPERTIYPYMPHRRHVPRGLSKKEAMIFNGSWIICAGLLAYAFLA